MMMAMFGSVLAFALLFGDSFAIRQVATSYVAAPDPGPSSSCPEDMRLVQGVHDDEMERLCLKQKGNRCWSYVPYAVATTSERKEMRFCMDQYEAPNKRGARPIVMKDFHFAQAFCAEKSKRVCSEEEFETACEGAELKPFFYGWDVDGTVCNSSKAWRQFDEHKLMAGGEDARQETERLWQGSKSGEFAQCRSAAGIYDLLGNVEEWVVSRKYRRYPGALMGGFWAKPWVGCRGTNDAHEPTFVFYEVGFRCCADAAP